MRVFIKSLYLIFKLINLNFNYKIIKHMGIGDWGLGIGDWGLGIGANTQ